MSLFSNRLLLVLSICLSIACGRDPSPRRSERSEVRLAVTRGGILYLPVFVAGLSGCFGKQDLTVKIEETEGAPKSMTALLAGDVDVVAAGYLQVLDLVAQGRRLRSFLLMQRFPGFAAIVSPRTSKHIQSIEDLKGVNVGVNSAGGESHRILNYVLRQHGLRPEDISAINLGPSVTQVLPSLERGLVDVMLAQGLTLAVLHRRYPNLRILFDTRTPEGTKAALGVEEAPQSVLIGMDDWLRSNADTARRLAGASQCAMAWIQGHTPEQIREILPVSCHSPDADADLYAILFLKNMLSADGRMTPEMHEAAVRISSVVNQAGLAKAYTNEFLKP